MNKFFAAAATGALIAATTSVAQGALHSPVTEVVRASQPAIARIVLRIPVRSEKGQGVRIQQGTGFLVDRRGDLVTNCHVVSASLPSGETAIGEATIDVTFTDELSRHLPARVLGCDEQGDIAVVHAGGVDPSRPPLRFADMRKVEVGEEVVAIGFAEGLPNAPTVTRGIVSALDRTMFGGAFAGLVQTDAAINHGNSGGPLLDLDGEVVGVNTYGCALTVRAQDLPVARNAAAQSDADVPVNSTGNSMGYARAADTAKAFADDIIANGRVSRADFGVEVAFFSNDEQIGLSLPEIGVFVRAIAPGSLAAVHGLRPGDVIYAVRWDDGEEIRTASVGAFANAMALTRPGRGVTLRVERFTKQGAEQALSGREVDASEVQRVDVVMDVGAPKNWSLDFLKRNGLSPDGMGS